MHPFGYRGPKMHPWILLNSWMDHRDIPVEFHKMRIMKGQVDGDLFSVFIFYFFLFLLLVSVWGYVGTFSWCPLIFFWKFTGFRWLSSRNPTTNECQSVCLGCFLLLFRFIRFTKNPPSFQISRGENSRREERTCLEALCERGGIRGRESTSGTLLELWKS